MNNRRQCRHISKPAWVRCLSAVLMAMALSACGVTDRVAKRVDDTWAGDMLFEDSEKVLLTADGGNQLNPDEAGKPLSVVLRVYQLSAIERFESIDADNLWDDPKKALGDTLIDNREIILLPGMGQKNQWPLNKAAAYVGIAAFFRSDENSHWKVAFDANTLRKDGIWFSSDGVRVLVDNNHIVAARGVDVLNRFKNEEQFSKANGVAAKPASPSMTERIGNAAAQQAEDSATESAKSAVDSQTKSLLEGAK